MGHKIASKKIAYLTGLRRPLVPDDAHAFKGGMVGSLPIIEHVIHYAIQALLRRVPWSHQVMVNVYVVDGADGRVGIGVSRQQRAFGVWVKVDRLLQKFHAGHACHSLIHDEERDRFISELQLPGRFDGGNARIGGDHLVTIAVVSAQIALQRPQHVGIVALSKSLV